MAHLQDVSVVLLADTLSHLGYVGEDSLLKSLQHCGPPHGCGSNTLKPWQPVHHASTRCIAIRPIGGEWKEPEIIHDVSHQTPGERRVSGATRCISVVAIATMMGHRPDGEGREKGGRKGRREG